MNILYRTVTTVTYTRIDGKGSSKTSIIIGNNEVVQKESLISQAQIPFVTIMERQAIITAFITTQ